MWYDVQRTDAASGDERTRLGAPRFTVPPPIQTRCAFICIGLRIVGVITGVSITFRGGGVTSYPPPQKILLNQKIPTGVESFFAHPCFLEKLCNYAKPGQPNLPGGDEKQIEEENSGSLARPSPGPSSEGEDGALMESHLLGIPQRC